MVNCLTSYKYLTNDHLMDFLVQFLVQCLVGVVTVTLYPGGFSVAYYVTVSWSAHSSVGESMYS